MNSIATINPATGEPIARYDCADDAQIGATLERMRRAQREWAARPVGERLEPLTRLANLFLARRDELARLMTREMGKPITQARAEVEKCAGAFRYYAEQAPVLLADKPVQTNAAWSGVVYQPLGIVFAIMPWNFPFWQAARFAAPALAAGNAGLLKPAPSTTGCGLALVRLAQEAGIPPGVLTTLVLDNDYAARVIADSRIAAITLTGSERAGRAVARVAGENLKKCVLELGGSDPFVVLADADLERAVQVAVSARFQNTGQSCIAAKRFIIEAPVYEEFVARFVAASKALELGDPAAEATDLGPLARDDLRLTLARQVQSSLDAGARLVTGGGIPARPGYYYEPTVLDGVRSGMAVATEEVFGPVAAIFRATDRAAALALANSTSYGLGGSVWTADREAGERFARGLASGLAFVNEMVQSDPRLPFGGIKHSGFGRELATEGLREFLNLKTLWIS